MSRRLPPLNAVRAFEAAGRYLSFTGAAQELRVTQSAVSRHVAGLEDWLGAKLFHRRQRGIALTPRGEAYFKALGGALDQIDDATARMRDGAEDRVLRLKLPPTFAIRWLIPRLSGFQALHPDIEVQITSSHEAADFDREDVDAFVRSEHGAPSYDGYQRLFGEVLAPVCSPALLARGPALDTPADLAGHVRLSSMHRPRDWPLWLAAANVAAVEARGAITFDNAALAYQAAVDGLGVAIAQQAFIAEDLRSGRLVMPFALPVVTQEAYYLGFHPDRTKAPRIAALEAWLMAEAAA
jgi:LysR family glycine cleavage system transcriptional activator